MNKSNRIDLLYLTNQNFIDKYNQKKINTQQNETLDDDIAFYRKRIFNTTKDLLRKKSVNSTVDSSFIEYCRELIKYFKFIDKKDVLQEEYKDLKEKKKKNIDHNFNLSENDKIMSKETKKTIRTIKDCIPIKVKTKPKQKRKYPKKKDVNIKDEKFRIKGLEKEKSNQFICPVNQNKKELLKKFTKQNKKENIKHKKQNENIKQKSQNKKRNTKQKKEEELIQKEQDDLISLILGK